MKAQNREQKVGNLLEYVMKLILFLLRYESTVCDVSRTIAVSILFAFSFNV